MTDQPTSETTFTGELSDDKWDFSWQNVDHPQWALGESRNLWPSDIWHRFRLEQGKRYRFTIIAEPVE